MKKQTNLITTQAILDALNQIDKVKFYNSLIQKIEKSFTATALANTRIQPKLSIGVTPENFIQIQAGHLNNNTYLKLVSVFRNKLPNSSTINGYNFRFAANRSNPLYIIETHLPTILRTAAASAVATKYLAKHDAKILGIIGAGYIGMAHIHFLKMVRKIERVLVFSRNRQRTLRFVKELNKQFNDNTCVISNSIEEVCRQSNVIVTCTSKCDEIPLVLSSFIQEGTHINSVGTTIEIEKKLLEKSKVIVDHLENALLYGECRDIRKQQIHGEIGQITSGLIEGRNSEQEITIFDSKGVITEDYIISDLLYSIVSKQNLAIVLPLENNKNKICEKLWSNIW